MNSQPPRANAPNRIRELREERGMTLEQLGAEVSEVTPATISKLEKGQMRLTLEYMQDIARALGVPLQDLVAPNPIQFRSVRVLGSITAGNWREAVEDAQGDIPVPPDIGGYRTFALRVQGDSMDKIAAEATYVTIDPDDLDLHDGKFYAVANGDGETTFKKYCSAPARLEPCSTNPAHRTIKLGHHPVQIIGRITFAGIDLR